MYIKYEIVKYTLQNTLFLHFFYKILAYIKKKQYFCTEILKKKLKMFTNVNFTYSRLCFIHK